MDVIDETEALQRFFEGKKLYSSHVDVTSLKTQEQMLYKA